MENRPPLPPFTTKEDADRKVRLAEDAWNTRNPEFVVQAYTENSVWRNRTEFLKGRDAIAAFLARKWSVEHDYRLAKELWDYQGNRMAVRFAYEWRDARDSWFRSYGNELWQFDGSGLMQVRFASINDIAITESNRLFHWPLGPRPIYHPSLSDLSI